MTLFVPEDHEGPEQLESGLFTLPTLTMQDVDKDFEAASSKTDHLCKKVPYTFNKCLLDPFNERKAGA